MFYRCIPNFAEETAAGVFADTGAKSFFEEIVADISGSAKEIIYMCLVALGIIYIIKPKIYLPIYCTPTLYQI